MSTTTFIFNKINECKHPSPLCPLCKSEPHTTIQTHLFNCTNIITQLKVTDLWTAPVDVANRWLNGEGHQSTSGHGYHLDEGYHRPVCIEKEFGPLHHYRRRVGPTTTGTETASWVSYILYIDLIQHIF